MRGGATLVRALIRLAAFAFARRRSTFSLKGRRASVSYNPNTSFAMMLRWISFEPA
jgi:hypothetical protein